MIFSINRRYFADALNVVSRAVSPQSPIPALSGIRLDVSASDLTLTGSDSNVAIKVVIEPSEESELVIEETGSIVIEARYLLEIVRKIECPKLLLETIDNTLIRISSDNGKYNLNSIDIMNYPDIDFSRPASEFELPAGGLHDIISQTAFACSDKEARPVLTGVNFRADHGSLVCSGTDSYRLAYKKTDLNMNDTFNITIPARSLLEVQKSLLETENPVQIFVDSKKAQFVLGNTTFQTRLIDGKFPDVEKIIPDPSRYVSRLDVNATELSKAIDRTNFIKTEKMHLVKLECSDVETRVKTNSAEIGNSDENLNKSKYEGASMNILINGSYLQDALKALKGDDILMEFTGVMSPVKITSKADNSTLMIVVPVRSYD